MIKILISIFNSIFFFVITLAFDQNWAVASLVAVAVWLITFYALCLAAMAHMSSNVLCDRDRLQALRDSFQLISQGAENKDYLKIPAQK
jgi:hypothetical protein